MDAVTSMFNTLSDMEGFIEKVKSQLNDLESRIQILECINTAPPPETDIHHDHLS